MSTTGKQIDEIIKNMLSINKPYKNKDIMHGLNSFNIKLSDKQLYHSLVRLVESGYLIRISNGLYIKNPHYFDGDSEFSKELYNVLTNFTENLCEMILKYNINKTNDKDNTRLNAVIHIKEYVDNLIKEMDDEMYFR